MSIKIGGIDVFRQSLDSEYRITTLEIMLEKILQKNPNLITQEEINNSKKEAIKVLQKKYPDAGIRNVGDEE